MKVYMRGGLDGEQMEDDEVRRQLQKMPIARVSRCLTIRPWLGDDDEPARLSRCFHRLLIATGKKLELHLRTLRLCPVVDVMFYLDPKYLSSVIKERCGSLVCTSAAFG